MISKPLPKPTHISFPLKWCPQNLYLLDADDRVVGDWAEPLCINDPTAGYRPRGFGWMEREEYDEWVAFFRQRVTPGMNQAEVLVALNDEG